MEYPRENHIRWNSYNIRFELFRKIPGEKDLIESLF